MWTRAESEDVPGRGWNVLKAISLVLLMAALAVVVVWLLAQLAIVVLSGFGEPLPPGRAD